MPTAPPARILDAVTGTARTEIDGRLWADLAEVERITGPLARRTLARMVRAAQLVLADHGDARMVRLFGKASRVPAPPPRFNHRPSAYALEMLDLAAEVVRVHDRDAALFMLDVAVRDRSSVRLGPERWAQVQLVERVAPSAAPTAAGIARRTGPLFVVGEPGRPIPDPRAHLLG